MAAVHERGDMLRRFRHKIMMLPGLLGRLEVDGLCLQTATNCWAWAAEGAVCGGYPVTRNCVVDAAGTDSSCWDTWTCCHALGFTGPAVGAAWLRTVCSYSRFH